MTTEEENMLETEKEPISKLLGSLKRVEAPGDFDFRVKARIANGRPADRNAALLPAWVRVAVPLVLLLFVGGYFGFNALYPDMPTVQPLAAVQPVVEPVSQASPVEEPREDVSIAKADNKPSDTAEVSNVVPSQKRVLRTGQSNKGTGIRDYEITQGIPQVKKLKNPKDIENPGGIPAKEILVQMGVDASYSNSSWKVGGVRPKSIAERAGLKAGDVIEGINDQNLTESTVLKSPFNGRTVRVLRDGKSVQIELKR